MTLSALARHYRRLGQITRARRLAMRIVIALGGNALLRLR